MDTLGNAAADLKVIELHFLKVTIKMFKSYKWGYFVLSQQGPWGILLGKSSCSFEELNVHSRVIDSNYLGISSENAPFVYCIKNYATALLPT